MVPMGVVRSVEGGQPHPPGWSWGNEWRSHLDPIDLGRLARTRELLEDGVVAFALEAVEEELALGGFAGAVEAFDGDEGAAAGRGGGSGHV